MLFSISDEFEINREQTSANSEFIHLDESLAELRDFLNQLGYLAFGRDMLVFRRIGPVDGSVILDSATRTMESIRYCCLNANFADAYSLLRKYRDDLFYYVYLFAVSDDCDLMQFVNIDELKDEEKKIWDWAHNKQKDLHIGYVLQVIASRPSVGAAVKKFNLKDSFINLGDKLNDYVHSNGRSFYNESYERLSIREKIKDKCEEFCEAATYITVVFIFLSVLINPLYIMSSDYVDYLDCGEIPPEGSQYWVAPFVLEFMNKHKDVLDEKWVEYLRENTEMEI